MWQELSTSCLLIFIAEIGDKSQLLAMAFATQYPASQVLLGISLGAVLNHGVAVLFGVSLGKIIPAAAVKLLAGLAFLIFALWTVLADDTMSAKQTKNKRNSAVIPISTAFFLGELGDKTQLTAIALATASRHPCIVLVGTVTGMIISGICGIYVGKNLGKHLGNHLPAAWRKAVPAVAFLLYGFIYLYQNAPKAFLSPTHIFTAIFGIGLSLLLALRKKGYL